MLSSRAIAQGIRAIGPRVSIAPRIATRSYATPTSAPASAASAPNPKPPIAVYGLDGTYATALYTAAAKSSSLDPIARALDNLSNVFKRDPKLGQILTAPTLTPSDKQQIVQELQRHAGIGGGQGGQGGGQGKGAAAAAGSDKGSETLTNFLKTLAENNRLSILEGVCEKFGMLMGAARGEVELVVTSAAPLDNKVLRQLENAVSKSQYVGQGKKLKVVPKVNPDIRGGLIVEIGDRTIDLSVSAKMARMNKLLKDTL